MSFEPTFTLLSHGESERKQYKCNLCVKDYTILSVNPGGYWNLKRHIIRKHSEIKENFEEMCRKNSSYNYKKSQLISKGNFCVFNSPKK